MFDPFSPEFTNNPYPSYAALREEPGLPYSEDMNAHMVARYKDVTAIAVNPKMVRVLDDILPPEEIKAAQRAANWHDMPNHERYVQHSLLDSDGDMHDRLRLLVMREFTSRFVERHRHMIRQFVDRLLDQLLEQQDFDFIDDLAAHVPGHIIGHVLGVPDEDCPQLRIWSEDIVQFFDMDRTQERKQLAERATTEFSDYIKGMVAIRRAAPKDDLLSTLIAAQDAGKMSETELISTSLLILMAGHGSTIDVLGTGLMACLRFPDQLQRLRDDPALIPSAVQEMFRYESPLPYFHRYATEEVEVAGKSYPKGTKFGLLYGAANRDPAQFPHPDTFDVGRAPNRHVAFGQGPHLCLGNQLSRLDMEVIFARMLSRTCEINLNQDAPLYRPGVATRGLLQLRVTMTPS